MLRIEKLTLLYLDCNIWTASRKVENEKINLPSLPSDLATPGSIKIVDPNELQVFRQVKSQVDAQCREVGTRFCGNWIIPNEKLDYLIKQLEQSKEDFFNHKKNFLDRYETICEDWVNKHPEFADTIKQLQLDREQINHKLHFDYITYQIGMNTYQDYKAAVDLIFSNELDLVTKAIKELVQNYLVKHNKIEHKNLDLLHKTMERLGSFHNLDPRFGFVDAFYKSAMGDLLKSKSIKDQDLERFKKIVFTIADREFLEQLINHNITDVEEILKLYDLNQSLIKSKSIANGDTQAQADPPKRKSKRATRSKAKTKVEAKIEHQANIESDQENSGCKVKVDLIKTSQGVVEQYALDLGDPQTNVSISSKNESSHKEKEAIVENNIDQIEPNTEQQSKDLSNKETKPSSKSSKDLIQKKVKPFTGDDLMSEELWF